MLRFTRHLLMLAGLMMLLTPAVILADRALFPIFHMSADDTDGPGERSGLALRTDAATGCQYLESRYGGLIPRHDRDGRHICAGVK